MTVTGAWGAFRRWPVWAQLLVWVAAWPVPLAMLALTRPHQRWQWVAATAAGAAVWAALVFSNQGEPRVRADDAVATTTTEASTTTERIGSTTTSTTELSTSGPIPGVVAGLTSDPRTTGGLSTAGERPFDVEALLAQLMVAPDSHFDDYDRDLFGGWVDADGDRCDTRAEVLMAESLTPAQVDPYGCAVVAGDWRSIYDGVTTGDPTDLDIDHLVPLGEAWVSGAWAWSPERRAAFANDLGHPGALVAVTAEVNRSKGDRDPSAWRPPDRASWCLYATDWVQVKVRWGLTATLPEVQALRSMLEGCGRPVTTAAPAITTTSRPPTTAAPPPPPPTSPPSRGSCDPSYPTVCISPPPPDLDCADVPYDHFEVRAPDPHRFDGDHDGVGCEG